MHNHPSHPPFLPPLSPGLSSTSSKPGRGVPLLTLAPPAVALGEDLSLGEPGEEHNVRDIWNVVTKASELVKDGERLENLAWRCWSQRRRTMPRHPSLSSVSACTGSSTSLHTPSHERPPSPAASHRSLERRTFGGALKLLLDDNDFRDWVTDAKRHLPIPTISVPDTPVANVEIRLVEPTPVPSRVGSLGGSMGATGLLVGATVPPLLTEEPEAEAEEEEAAEDDGVLSMAKPPISGSRSPKKKGKFFFHSSPGRGSGSDTSQPSPLGAAGSADKVATPTPVSALAKSVARPPSKSNSNGESSRHLSKPERRSSGSSSGGAAMKPRESGPKEKRHVSLSTMRGKYAAEKRKAAEALHAKHSQAAAQEEDSGWEDEDEENEEDWSDEPDSSPKKSKKAKQHRRSSSRSRSAHSTSNIDLASLVRQSSRKSPTKDAPPPPAPTPLRKMSKKERVAAAAERAKIEAELDAQRKREMFAKQQIFGGLSGAGARQSSEGLLSGIFKRGGSMVNLTEAGGPPPLRPSPTHGHLPSLARSPAHAPAMLRSKSAVAMPVQTGVSVTVSPLKSKLSEEISSQGSGQSTTLRAGPSDEHANEDECSHERRGPQDVVMESSDEESGDDDYLATSRTNRRIAELAAKRDSKAKLVPQAEPLPPSGGGGMVDEYGVVQPSSPTTRRRLIIMREMSESLRRNLILEREKSSGGKTSRQNSIGQPTQHARPAPSTHTSILPLRGSSTNLAQYREPPVPLARHRSDPSLVTAGQVGSPQNGSGHSGPPIANPPPGPNGPSPLRSSPSPVNPGEPLRRRAQPNVLGGFLRPLTRVGENMPINRTQSSANLTITSAGSSGSASASPISRSAGTFEAPAMVRSSTEGDPRDLSDDERLRMIRKKELAKRSETMDTSYRSHGW